QLAAIWAQVLKVEKVGRTDNFFELGGDSIVSIQVVSRARQLNILFTPRALFEQQTVQALATVAKREAALAIEQSAVTGELPLTPVQRMFFERDIPARHHWNQSVLLQVNEPLLPEWVEKALQVLHTQHDVLRLGFAQQQGHWRAEHTAPGAGSLAQEVLWVRQATSQEHLTALCQQAQESLNLQQGPLLRALLVDMFDGSQRLLLVIHHLVVDGVSWRILLDDLQTACQAMARGATVTLPSKTTSFKAWAQRLEHHATGLQGQLAYWQAQLQDASDNLPRDRAQGGCQGRHAISVVTQLRRDDTERLLQQAPAAYRTQINDLLLTALSRVICRWTGQSSALVRLEGHGREDLFREVDITRTVGWFTSMYPVKLTPADSVADAIKGVKEQLRAVPDKGIGYGLLRYLGTAEARATLQALPQGEIVFNYLGQFDQSFDAQHGLFAPALEHGGAGQSPDAPLDSLISINGQVYAGELVLKWTFSREIFERSTLQRLADDYALELKAVIDHCVNGQATGVTPSDFPLARLTQAQLDSLPVPANDIADLYPLSPMQQGMLFHSLEDTQAGLYINQTSVPVSGLDARRFVEAWRQVVNYHDILRTSFHTGGLLGEPVQLVHRDVELEVNLLDWRGEADAPGGIERLIEADAHRAFDLARAPLMRLTLIELGEQRQHLIWTAHHVLLDGWSTSQLLGEVLARYAGQTVEQAPGRYRQYIDWLQRQDDDASEVFWRRHLQALDGPTLLSSAGAAPAQGLNGHAALYLNWDASRTARLHQCAQRLRVTPNTLVQATWLMLLQRYTGQETVCFGATVAGRPAALAGADKMLGLFINTVPVVQTPAPERRVASWLQALQHYNLEARDHEHTSLADIQRWGGQSGQALFDSIIVFENYPIDERLAQAGHQDVSFGKVKNRDVTNFAMDLAVHLGSTLSIEFLYLRNRFTEQATAQILACFQHLLQSLLDNPDACIGQLAMHPAVVLPITDPAPVRPSVAELISRQARLQPGAIAVCCAGQSLTYAQLEQRAEHLARVLRAQGVAAEARVGVAMERSVDTLVAFYAVLKAGGAFVPLDIDYPKERLQWIVQDASLSLLLSHSSVAGRLPPLPGTPYLEMDSLDLSAPCIDQAESAVSVDNLAYLIYTSGSTGLPKGVAVSHGPLSMHCQAIIEAYEMDASTRELHFMSFAFDGAQERWLSTLISGGQLVLRDSQLWTPEQTFQALHDHGITIACFPPAYLQQLAEHAATQPSAPPVRIYCFGGDAVADSTFERVKATLRPKYLTNGYGPTETVVTPLLWKAAAQEGCQAPIAPIGSAVGERTLYVLDAQLNLLPEGVAGELYIGGYGLARGYHERPGLSAERFVADPFSVGGRLYRTGDLVRRRADGVFDYLGRLDNQVKIRGFRIELGEVEACLRLQPQVRDAVVVAWDGGTGKQLIGYVVAEDSAAELPKHLRGEMQSRLPDYMVPAQIIVLPAFPLSPNGKLDRKALPAPGQMGERDSFIAPRNELERQLAQVWSEVLGIERVGVTDNFFELGGDSLRSLKVISRVRALQLSGFELRLRDLMTRPTIADLSGYDEASAAVDPLLLLNRQVIGMAPLFCIHAGFGTVFDYEPLARRLDGQVSVYGLQCRMLLDPDWRDAGLRSMAADYAMHIRRKQPDGPYHLLGWSLGGTLAALVAHELECQGQRVASLSLVDSFIPQPPAVETEQQSDWRAELVEFLQVLVPGHGKVAWESPAPGDLPDRVALATLIEAALAAPGAGVSDGSVQWSVDDLALGFSVAMHLKAVSRLPVELPSLQARPRFLWADARNQEAKRQFESVVSPAGVHRQFDTDHYGMLKMPEVIEEVVVALAGSPDRVGG
ncbi:non-ribosomal peptide synthetase, partial [Pseudomonas sp. RIT-To-2]|uniref:non-ribosomal peptide synthetase n=1 Tax=Pseudomonas sp. RIT-To-2 TaxID=3462541 RepID=UPI0024137A62